MSKKIESIMKSFNVTIKKLEDHSIRKSVDASWYKEESSQLLSQAKACDEESSKAKNIADKLKSLFT